MNYLAHTVLSPDDPQILMGNVWGDLLKPSDYPSLAPGILDGVERHKRIDAFTDRHEAVDEIVRILRPYQGKYTPVVADVMMDFMLSKYWHEFYKTPIEKFCSGKYRVISGHLSLIPGRIHPRVNRMLDDHWLESCKNRERMQRTLHMLSYRASFANTIPAALEAYDRHETALDMLFLEFFRELKVEFEGL